MFGGYSFSSSTFSQTLYSHVGGDVWHTISSTGPAKRAFAAMAYDRARGEIVLFGGLNSSFATLGDTWVWKDSTQTWTQITGAGPSARWGATMAWDPAIDPSVGGAVVLIGGASGYATGSPADKDMWAFDGTSWQQLSSSVPMGARDFQQLTFDAHLPLSSSSPSGELVTFGGDKMNSSTCVSSCAYTAQNDTWVYDGTSWTQIATGDAPSARWGYAMAYDAAAQQEVLYGGYDGSIYWGDTWRFDGTEWVQATGIGAPSGRAYMQMIFDGTPGDDSFTVGSYNETDAGGANGSDQGSIYGGYDGTTSLAQEWQFSHHTASVTVAQPAGALTQFTVGQVIQYDVTISNTSPYPVSLTNAVATLPNGLSASPITVTDTDTIPVSSCTTASSSPCSFGTGLPTVSFDASTPTITFGGSQIPGFTAEHYHVYTTAQAVKSGAQAFNCQATGLADPSLSGGGSPSAQQVQSDNPYGFWRLDDTGATATNTGSSGSALNGTYAGSVTRNPTGGTSDGDGSIGVGGSGSMGFPTTPSFASNGFTVEAWVKPTALGPGNLGYLAPIVFMSSDTSNDNEIYFGTGSENNSLVADITNNTMGTSEVALAGDGLQPNSWQLVAVTAQPTPSGLVITLYRDGLPIATTTRVMTLPSVSRPYGYLAKDAANGVSTFQGGIDDVAIYPNALPATRLLAHYQAGTSTGAGSLTTTETEPVAATYKLVSDSDTPVQSNRLDDAAGQTHAAPAFPGAQTLTAVGGVTFGAPGLLNGDNDTAATFNGSSGYLQMATNPTTSTKSSIEAWFKTSATHGQVIVGAVSSYPSGAPTYYVPELWIGSDGKVYGEFWNGSVDPLVSSLTYNNNQPYNDGKVHEVSLTSSGTGEFLYIDGQRVAFNYSMAAQTINTFETKVSIGTGYTSSTWPGLTNNTWNYFQGTLDEVQFYNHELTQSSEIAHWFAGIDSPFSDQNTAFAPTNNTNPSNPLPAALTICDSGLGLEPWWSYTSTPTSATSTAEVNVADGNLVVPTTDSTPVQAHGRLGLEIHRTYNSQDSSLVSTTGSFGAGWQLSVGQTDALAGGGVTSTGLQVPSAISLLNQVTSPLDITLIDRDGTRHVFTPASIGTPIDAGGSIPALLKSILNLGATGTVQSLLGIATSDRLCVDQTYTAPRGVHLSLWRYVDVGSGTCSGGMSGGNLIGYVTERPDRLETLYNALGRTVAMRDGAGATLDYAYNASGGLAAVYDNVTDSSGNPMCTVNTVPTLPTVTGPCRSIRFSYPSSTETDVTDPAGRITKYTFTSASLNLLGASVPTTVKLLTQVQNPTRSDGSSGSTLIYNYEQHAGTDCGAANGQLCSITDEDGNTTSFHYTAPTGVTGVFAFPQVTRITDRRGNTTTLSYSATKTTVTAQGAGTGADRETDFASIDKFGRVGEIYTGATGVTPSTALRNTSYFWDSTSTGASCQQPAGANNNLCEIERAGSTNPSSGIATPDQDSVFVYDDAGMVESTVQNAGRPSDPESSSNPYTTNIDGAGPSVETINGYKRLYLRADGTISAQNEAIGLNGGSLSMTQPKLTDAISTSPGTLTDPVVFTLADQTQSAPARAAADPSNWQQYLTSYVVDDSTTSAPNSSPSTGDCTSAGAATGNTGLVCAATHDYGPPGAGTPPTATTTATYNSTGQQVTKKTPNGNTYTFGYFPTSATDLSGTTNAGGWLATVTDPTTNFVAYGYDAAGNLVRTWNRNATHGNSATAYPGTTSSPGPGAFSQTLFGSGATASAISDPWRWVEATTDPVGNTTSHTTDELGDYTSTTSPNAHTSYAAFDANGNQLRTVDAVQGSSSSNNVTFTTFDAFNEPTSVTTPNQAAADAVAGHPLGSGAVGASADSTLPSGDTATTTTSYDTAGDATATTTLRGSSATYSTPAGCSVSAGMVQCTAIKTYDTLGDVVASQDATGATTTIAYDALGRSYRVKAPSNGTTTPTSYTNLDPNGNAVDACTPRQLTDGTGGCTASSIYATHTSYDLADQPTNTVRNRNASTTLTTTKVYDADANVTETCQPRQYSEGSGACNGTSTYASFTTYNSLDRPIATMTPQSTAIPTDHTYTVYDPSGDVLATVADGVSSDNPAGTGAGQAYRITGYTYDADLRPVDTVKGLQVPSSDPTPDTDANRAAIATAMSTDLADGTKNVRSRNVYDGDGNVIGVYNGRAFTTSVTSPDATFMIATAYDADDRPTSEFMPRFGGSVTDPNSDTTQSSQCPASPSGLPAGVSYPSGVHVCQTKVVLDQDGNVVTKDLPAFFGGNTHAITTSVYTSDDLLASVTGPDPSSSSHATTRVDAYSYDADGRQLSVTDANGLTDCTLYNTDGSVAAQLTDAGSSCSTMTHKEEFGYDADGNQVLDQLDTVTVAGNVLNLPTTTSYTADDLKSAVSTPASNTTSGAVNKTQYGYDADGNATSVTSPDATATDSANQRGLPTVSTFTYADQLAATYAPIDAKTGDQASWRRIKYSYNPGGDKTTTQADTVQAANTTATDPTAASLTAAGGSQTFSYYPDGLLNVQGGRNNGGGSTETITNSYNAAGDLTGSTNAEPALGSGNSATTAYSDTLSASYYADGRIRAVDDGARTTTASYDGAGMLSARSSAADLGGSPTATSYGYGDADLVTTESDGNAGSYSWSYDPGGRPTSESLPNGDTTTWSYTTGQDTLHTTATKSGSGTTLAQDCYTYDEAFRVLTQDDATTSQPSNGCNTAGVDASDTYAYSYFPSGAVASFTNGTQSAVNYSYDHDTNRLGSTDPSGTTQTTTYNADNSIATDKFSNDAGSTRSDIYDSDGRLTNDGCNAYTYDGFDRQTAVAPTSPAPAGCQTSPTVTYNYDGQDRQTSRTATTYSGGVAVVKQTTAVGYDLLSQTVDTESDSTTLGGYSGLTEYTLDAYGSPISLTRSNSTGTGAPPNGVQQLIQDGNNSITAVANSNGTSLCDQRFDPFGQSDGDSAATFGPSGCGIGFTASSLGYQTTRTDSSTGNLQYGSRTYNPTTATFTTPDGFRTGTPSQDLSVNIDPLTENTYTYVNGDPINLNDPDGHRPACDNASECRAAYKHYSSRKYLRALGRADYVEYQQAQFDAFLENNWLAADTPGNALFREIESLVLAEEHAGEAVDPELAEVVSWAQSAEGGVHPDAAGDFITDLVAGAGAGDVGDILLGIGRGAARALARTAADESTTLLEEEGSKVLAKTLTRVVSTSALSEADAATAEALQESLSRAVVRFLSKAEEGGGLTARQTEGLAKYAGTKQYFAKYALRAGERIDTFFKEDVLLSAKTDPRLAGVRVTARFEPGPDVISPTGTWFDATTGDAAWARHVQDYTGNYGPGVGVLYGSSIG